MLKWTAVKTQAFNSALNVGDTVTFRDRSDWAKTKLTEVVES